MKMVIYGNGAMARVLYSYARHSHDIAGFTVDDYCIHDGENSFLGRPLVPFSQAETFFNPSQHAVIVVVGYLEMNRLRQRKSQECIDKGFSLASYVHNSVLRHDGVSIGEGSIVLDHVSIHYGSEIGNGTFISSNVNIGHDCRIGEWNWINSGVAVGGCCTVGQGGFFGINSCVADGITMGERNFVAANTLINRNTENDKVYLSEAGQEFRLSSESFLRFARMTK